MLTWCPVAPTSIVHRFSTVRPIRNTIDLLNTVIVSRPNADVPHLTTVHGCKSVCHVVRPTCSYAASEILSNHFCVCRVSIKRNPNINRIIANLFIKTPECVVHNAFAFIQFFFTSYLIIIYSVRPSNGLAMRNF